jgi:hypothetical protein
MGLVTPKFNPKEDIMTADLMGKTIIAEGFIFHLNDYNIEVVINDEVRRFITVNTGAKNAIYAIQLFLSSTPKNQPTNDRMKFYNHDYGGLLAVKDAIMYNWAIEYGTIAWYINVQEGLEDSSSEVEEAFMKKATDLSESLANVYCGDAGQIYEWLDEELTDKGPLINVINKIRRTK